MSEKKEISKVPPCNIDAEISVLGAAMDADSEVMSEIMDVLGKGGDWFYKESHQHIYDAMITLHEKDTPIDLVSVTATLKMSGQLEKCGGVPYLDQMIDSVPAVQNVAYYAGLVKEAALLRSMGRNLSVLLQDIYLGQEDFDALIRRLRSISDEIPIMAGIPVYSISAASAEYARYVEQIQKAKIRFGWPEIDHATRGLIPGDVCIILARSGVGKSAIVQSLQIDVWKRQQVSSIFFSLEMPVTAVYERMASMVSGWNESEVEARYRAGEGQAIVDWLGDFAGIYYVDQAGLSLDDIYRVSRQHEDAGMLIIDYMGLVQSQGKTDYERVSHVARGLKELAKKTQTAVVCVCQTNRMGGDGTIPVSVHMGRDSGATEECADVILGMHKDEIDRKVIHIYVLKARRGRAGAETEMMFFGDTPRLVPLGKESNV